MRPWPARVYAPQRPGALSWIKSDWKGTSIDQVEVSDDARYTVTDFSAEVTACTRVSEKAIDSTDACACMHACSDQMVVGGAMEQSHQMSDGRRSHACHPKYSILPS
jgi:hypothetical protein